MISIDDGYTVPVGNLSPVASLGTPRQPPSVQTGKAWRGCTRKNTRTSYLSDLLGSRDADEQNLSIVILDALTFIRAKT